MKNLREKINSFLKENNLKYFKSDDSQDVYRIILPYKYKNIKRINIFIDVYSEFNLLKIGFHADANIDLIDDLKTSLLDMNGKLISGSLSLEKGDNTVKYSIDWEVPEDGNIDYATYFEKLLLALNVYAELYSNNLILQTKGI